MRKAKLIVALLLFCIVALKAQIPSGYYDGTQGLYGDDLKTSLHNIIDDHIEFSYNDLRDFILINTDEDPNNSNNVILLYTGRSQAKNTFGGGANDWNREHVWAKSHGGFGNNPPAGTDDHHIRPTDASVNSSRGNLDFDMGGSPVPEATGCYKDSDSFEPRDAVKGDVARMIFYMATRYNGGGNEPSLEVVDMVNTSPNPQHGKLSQLLLWNVEDPPDDFEQNRNDVIYYQYQNNRNPFIDHPEFADAIWGNQSGNSEMGNLDMKIYPNPATSNIKIILSKKAETEFFVLSTYGNKVIKGNFSKRINHLNIDHIPDGMYYLVTFNDQTIITTRFIKTSI
jgi:endonuclease I